MSVTIKSIFLLGVFLIAHVKSAEAQVGRAEQVPLETATGWGPLKAPAGYKSLRIQGRSSADALVLARLFGDFAKHPAMFPRVVAGVDIHSCDVAALKATYRTIFDSRPGGKTTVESLSAVKVSVSEDRVEFTWRSDNVKSSFVNAAQGRAMFVTRRTPNGTETLIDYVSAIRPKNAAKGILVESQRSVLANDAKYVIDRLMAAAEQNVRETRSARSSDDLFNCPP
jgi:hypothetical protein